MTVMYFPPWFFPYPKMDNEMEKRNSFHNIDCTNEVKKGEIGKMF